MPYVGTGRNRRVYFETTGPADAPPLLLIMGMGFSSRAWATLPSLLADRFRVITFDNRGTGRSSGTGAVFRVKDMAEDAVAVLDAAGARRACVFGVSMGGMVALELALESPERVRALVLGATFAGWLGSRKPSPAVISDIVVGGVLSRMGMHRLLGQALVSGDVVENEYGKLSAWIEAGERVSPRLLVQQMTAVTLHATTSRLGKVACPTLVLTGDSDRLVPEKNSRRLAELIPGARLVVLGGAGHCFPLEQPEETLAELVRFLGEEVPARERVTPDFGARAAASTEWR